MESSRGTEYAVTERFSFLMKPYTIRRQRAAIVPGEFANLLLADSVYPDNPDNDGGALPFIANKQQRPPFTAASHLALESTRGTVPGSPCGVTLARYPKARTSHQAHGYYSTSWVSRVTELRGN